MTSWCASTESTPRRRPCASGCCAGGPCTSTRGGATDGQADGQHPDLVRAVEGHHRGATAAAAGAGGAGQGGRVRPEEAAGRRRRRTGHAGPGRMRTLACATARVRNAKRWKPGTVTWEELLTWAENPADAKECGNYVLGRLDGDTRGKNTILSRSALTLDADTARLSLPDEVDLVLPCASLVHTTWTHSPDQPRYRVIIPLSRDVTPEEYHALAVVVMQLLGWDQFDPGSVQPERYMFKPSAKHRPWYRWSATPGDPLDVEPWLA